MSPSQASLRSSCPSPFQAGSFVGIKVLRAKIRMTDLARENEKVSKPEHVKAAPKSIDGSKHQSERTHGEKVGSCASPSQASLRSSCPSLFQAGSFVGIKVLREQSEWKLRVRTRGFQARTRILTQNPKPTNSPI